MEKLPIDPLKSRLIKLSDKWENTSGLCVLYVMSRDQRVHDNHALLAAQKHALKLGLPMAVIFVLQVVAQNRAYEQYTFMLDGLEELEQTLATHNIPLITLVGKSTEKLQTAFGHLRPAAVYVDFNPLCGPRRTAEMLATDWPIIVVDTHNVVPVWLASQKQEIGARTLRPKIHRMLAEYMVEPDILQVNPHAWPNDGLLSLAQVRNLFADLLHGIPKNHTKIAFRSGELAAHVALNNFLDNRLRGYATKRNDPSVSGTSDLSPYLHFGQLSSLRVMLEVLYRLQQDASLQPDCDALLEEIIIRKELSDNFCYYNNFYDTLAGSPEWAQKTLAKHTDDIREYVYSAEQFETAQTHDEAWNAAERQLTKTGKIHGYMRMYWAKKVLEWSNSPQEALQTLIRLNDFYSIDGGDPNGYVGILWSIAGLHDRPWGERDVYGMVRCMVFTGLKRKFDIQAYIDYN